MTDYSSHPEDSERNLGATSPVKENASRVSPSPPSRQTSQVASRQRMLTLKIVKQTGLIMATFLICWTPYVVLQLWYIFDLKSALNASAVVTDTLFIFASSNSAINPFIYGRFVRNSANDNVAY